MFISIDDNEVHHLRKLCDEVFGESNFVANVVWQKKYAVSNDDPGIAPMHDHILVFQKSGDFERNLLPRTEKQLDRYKTTDKDVRGAWSSDNYISNKSKSERPTLWYPIKHPKTGEDVWPDESAVWRYSKEKHEQIVAENRLYWGSDDSYKRPRLKRFLAEIQDGVVPSSWWTFTDVGHNDEGQKETYEILGKKIFSTPKPVRLLKRIAEIAMSKDDIVLDFFGGSGTTGHAVMELNKADGGTRQFILVQIPEQTDEASEAYKAGYKKISDITIARNQKVAAKLAKEGVETGFKVFKLAMSNFPRVLFELDPKLDEAGNLARLQQYINEKERQLFNTFDEANLLTEIIIKRGFNLNYVATKAEQFTKNNVLWVTDGNKKAFVCLDDKLADESVAYFSKNTSEHFICLERALDTTKKWNLKHAMGHLFFAF